MGWDVPPVPTYSGTYQDSDESGSIIGPFPLLRARRGGDVGLQLALKNVG